MRQSLFLPVSAAILVSVLMAATGEKLFAIQNSDSDGEDAVAETTAVEEITADAVDIEETEEASEPTSPLDDEGRLVRFERDVVPILREHCLECHGPRDAKNDFRVDDPDSLLAYVEPEDPEWSTLYADYLTVDDPDMLMPPPSHGGPLSAEELALIRVWISEGAVWPEDYQFVTDESAEATEPVPAEPTPRTLPARVWVAQGYLHPATVHFPIAFFLLGGVFVVLGLKWPVIGTQIPLACLLLGAASAIAATTMGWAFAPVQGYGSSWQIWDWDREVDVHRWSGLIVTLISVIFAIIALVSIRKNSRSLTKAWKIGLVICAMIVGLVGHQGGEMRYGADFYPRAWRILTGTDQQQDNSAVEATAKVRQEINR